MELLIATTEVKPDAVEEFARIWQEELSAKLLGEPGFLKAFLGASPEQPSRLVAVAMWDPLPRQERLHELTAVLLDRTVGMAERPPSFEFLHVVGEVA